VGEQPESPQVDDVHRTFAGGLVVIPRVRAQPDMGRTVLAYTREQEKRMRLPGVVGGAAGGWLFLHTLSNQG
jgi:hypothetical protein